MELQNTCYACDQPARSDEHFPPKCFMGKPYPIDYTTVRSCSKHNEDRGKDDEYVASLTLRLASLTYEREEEAKTMVRGAMRRDASLQRRVERGAVELSTGSLAFRPNTLRLSRVFGDIARAAYFVESGRRTKLKGELLIISRVVARSADARAAEALGLVTDWCSVTHAVAAAFDNTDIYPVRGGDTERFFYQVSLEMHVVLLVFRSVMQVIVVDPNVSSRSVKL